MARNDLGADVSAMFKAIPGLISPSPTTTDQYRCDADPTTLADYVEALLKHAIDMSEEEWKIVSGPLIQTEGCNWLTKQFITRELADFLEDRKPP